MPLRYKIDVLEALKEKGFTTYILRKESKLSQSTIQKLREGKGIAWENLENLCALLDCQPGDSIEYVKDRDDFQLLTEKEYMWAKMIEEVLKDNDIPCVTVPVLGAGFTLKTGMQERLKIFVPSESKARAEELMKELFPDE
jgi:putative transcriptional regulator